MSNINAGKGRGWLSGAALCAGLGILCGCAQSVGQREGTVTAVTVVPKTNAIAAQPMQTSAAAAVEEHVSRTVLPPGASKAPAPFEGEGWMDMFNGVDLTGWKETKFAGRGEVECVSGVMVLNMGDPFTGVNYTNSFPTNNYELAFDAMRVMGSDFFCGLTLPVGDSHCSLIVGGWGGALVGLSSLDGMDASENETTKYVTFESGRWYRIRVRVTTHRIEGWIDQDKIIDVNTRDRKVSTRPGEIEMSKPLGLACWQTTGAYREIRMRNVSGAADKPRRGF